MSSDITLSAGVRQNLLSLQNTADLMALTQNRLATGKKVNSALDNPNNFFTSEILSARAGDLSGLLDGISNSIKTLEAADNGIRAITNLVESAQSIVKQAQQANSDTSTAIEGSSAAAFNAAGATTQEKVLNTTLDDLAFADGDTISIDVTNSGVTTSYTYTIGTASTETVQDLIDGINSSGIVSAEITDSGTFKITGGSSDDIDLTVVSADAATGTTIADAAIALGFDVGAVGSTTDGTNAGDVDTTVFSVTGGGSTTDNSELVDQYNEILKQIDELAADASYNGINLLDDAAAELEVAFNEHRDSNKSSLVIDGEDLTSSGLSLSAATNLDDADSDTQLDNLSSALDALRSAATKFGSNLSTVQIRSDFTSEMINTLQTGADNLVLADTNEEGANMLALQTRQQLSTTALSLASQADQAVLSLF
jgi:flagellin-like hook-associated protein FlgL